MLSSKLRCKAFGTSVACHRSLSSHKFLRCARPTDSGATRSLRSSSAASSQHDHITADCEGVTLETGVKEASSSVTPCTAHLFLQQTAASLALLLAISTLAPMASDAGSLPPDSLPALAQLADSSASVATGHMPMYSLAEGQEFWGNVARYGRYFVTVMLGTGYVMLRPLTSALKNPVSAILAVGGLVGTVLFVKVTLELMLGTSSLEPFEYVQGQF